MTTHLLDTNMVSLLVRENPVVIKRVRTTRGAVLGISSITCAELLYGLAKRPEATMLARLVEKFLADVPALPWDAKVSAHYATLRAGAEAAGKSLSPNDMLIAAHADALGLVMVTADRAFARVPGLAVEDWSAPV